MKRETFEELLTTWFKDQIELHRRKSHDYATEDCLANFKRVYAVCHLYDIRPGARLEDTFLFYVLIKLDRLCNLLHSGETPANESLQDTVKDMSLYLALMRAALVEQDADQATVRTIGGDKSCK